MQQQVALLREHPLLREAAWVGVTLGIDPAVVLDERDDWRRAARIAAAELIHEAREEASRG